MFRMILLSLLILFSTAIYANVDIEKSLRMGTTTVTQPESFYQITVNYPKLMTENNSAKIFNDDIEQMTTSITDDFTSQLSSPENIKKLLQEFNQQKKDKPIQAVDAQTLHVENKTFVTNNKIISVQFMISSYFLGSAHPSTSYQTISYNHDTKATMTLDSLFKSNFDYLGFLSTLSREHLAQKMAVTKLNKNFLIQGTAPDIKNFQYWNITPEGLMLTYPPAQVAPYYFGTQQLIVPWSVIKPFLADCYQFLAS